MDKVQISSHRRRGVTSHCSRRLWIVWACGIACTPAAMMPTGDARSPVSQGIPPLLGILGLPMWAQYETVIDYARRQLTLIPVDTLGRRLAVVPWYTPRRTVPIFYGPYFPQGEYWFLQAQLGGIVDTLVIDTGNRLNELNAATQPRFARHLTQTGRTEPTDGENTPEVTLDRLDIAGQSYAAVPSYVSHHREDSIGDAFLRHLGVVGFNFAAHQLIVYQ